MASQSASHSPIMRVLDDDSSSSLDVERRKVEELFAKVRSLTTTTTSSAKAQTNGRGDARARDEPDWVREAADDARRARAMASAMSSSETSEDSECDRNEGDVRATRGDVVHGEGDETRGEGEDANANATTTTKSTKTKIKIKNAASATMNEKENETQCEKEKESSEGRSTMELVSGANAVRNASAVLFEIEGRGDAVDLDGDTGAVGRWLAEDKRALKVDMKGVMYNARVVRCAGTVVVVAASAGVAKIESVHREFVQLREDAFGMNGDEHATTNAASLFAEDVEDESNDVDDDAERETAGAKRKRADAGGAKPRKPATKRKAQGKKPKAQTANKGKKKDLARAR